jgi:hypothetical protein
MVFVNEKNVLAPLLYASHDTHLIDSTSDYEKDCPLGCCTMYFGIILPEKGATVQKTAFVILHPDDGVSTQL